MKRTTPLLERAAAKRRAFEEQYAVQLAQDKRDTDTRFAKEILPTLSDVGVIATTHEDNNMTFLYVPLTELSWNRVTEYVASLPKSLSKHVDAYCALEQYIESNTEDGDDKPLSTHVITADDRTEWTVLRAWPAQLPQFVNAEMLFLPSWT